MFQVHGIDANETAIVRKRFRRSQVLAFFKALPPCLIGMEACATEYAYAVRDEQPIRTTLAVPVLKGDDPVGTITILQAGTQAVY